MVVDIHMKATERNLAALIMALETRCDNTEHKFPAALLIMIGSSALKSGFNLSQGSES